MKRILCLLAAVLPGPLKSFVYRSMGMAIGRGVRIGFGTLLLCDEVSLADGVVIGHFNLIRARRLRMGKRSSIGNITRVGAHTITLRSQSSIGSQNEVSGNRDDERSELYLGPASSILPHCFVNVSRPIRLGRNVGVGGGTYLFTHGYWLSKLDGFPVAFGGITIGNDVWLPWRCFVMPNVTIASDVVVGASSVINKDLPEGVLAAGIPAKVIRPHAADPVTEDQKRDIFRDATEQFGRQRGQPWSVETVGSEDRHILGGALALVVHQQTPTRWHPDVLNVTFESPPDADLLLAPIWSLATYRSSPHASIPAVGRRWLEFGREFGFRFYPVDEDFE